MVALTGVAAAGEARQILRPVQVVLPQPVIIHGGVGVALHQMLPLLRGHHAENGDHPLLHAPPVDLVQRGVHIPLPRQGHRVVEDVAQMAAAVEHHQTAVALRVGRVQWLRHISLTPTEYSHSR